MVVEALTTPVVEVLQKYFDLASLTPLEEALSAEERLYKVPCSEACRSAPK